MIGYARSNPTPRHYGLLASELSRLGKAIQNSLSHRPGAAGSAWRVAEAAAQMLRREANAVSALARALEPFSSRMFGYNCRPSPEEVIKAVETMALPVYELLMIRHDLWKRPFPSGMEGGQALLSAIIERPLNDVAIVLDKVISIIADPDRAIRDHGTEVFRFNVVFRIDEEAAAFEDWCIINELMEPRELRSIVCLFSSTAAAFALGYWWAEKG